MITTIRKGFIRAADGTWYNLQHINLFEITLYDDKYAVVAHFDFMKECCYNLICEFHTKIEAQKFLDDLMDVKVSDFSSIDCLGLTVKTDRLLKNFNIGTVGGAKRLRLSEWNEQRGCGTKGWNELQEKLDNYLQGIGESRYG